ncbi:replication initiation protein [Hymenobacter monticola]|uniref:Replication initiation protein n=1 Tax=Hymenobacter monticola TaxID=1705399 RepID=A0ABY4BCH5_9BACT|nr:replication initiation protein [Hymenobacter monticola]UOE36780.1 replication initiation protein [Hymenobacter monticola]
MKAIPLNAEHPALPSDLLIHCPLALEPVEAHLFVLALGCLTKHSQRLTFQLTFADVLPDVNVDDQFVQLDKAQKRLMQPLKYEGLRLGKRFSHRIPMFTEMSIDQDTGLMTGVFNDYLRQYLLELADEYTAPKLEALLMHR